MRTMPFEKGDRANPKGRPKVKPWADALRIAASCEHGKDKKKTKLRAIAEKTVSMALNGDIAAIKEIGDRLEGKPAQSEKHEVELYGKDGGAIEHNHEYTNVPRPQDFSDPDVLKAIVDAANASKT